MNQLTTSTGVAQKLGTTCQEETYGLYLTLHKTPKLIRPAFVVCLEVPGNLKALVEYAIDIVPGTHDDSQPKLVESIFQPPDPQDVYRIAGSISTVEVLDVLICSRQAWIMSYEWIVEGPRERYLRDFYWVWLKKSLRQFSKHRLLPSNFKSSGVLEQYTSACSNIHECPTNEETSTSYLEPVRSLNLMYPSNIRHELVLSWACINDAYLVALQLYDVQPSNVQPSEKPTARITLGLERAPDTYSFEIFFTVTDEEEECLCRSRRVVTSFPMSLEEERGTRSLRALRACVEETKLFDDKATTWDYRMHVAWVNSLIRKTCSHWQNTVEVLHAYTNELGIAEQISSSGDHETGGGQNPELAVPLSESQCAVYYVVYIPHGGVHPHPGIEVWTGEPGLSASMMRTAYYPDQIEEESPSLHTPALERKIIARGLISVVQRQNAMDYIDPICVETYEDAGRQVENKQLIRSQVNQFWVSAVITRILYWIQPSLNDSMWANFLSRVKE
ncbi:hypothetical protein OF83DRAFT_1168327 [Amylostereum chailletii]|nr:hypothetical protein OF83DRAFT_1168327 [Amylostereum chailletii]